MTRAVVKSKSGCEDQERLRQQGQMIVTVAHSYRNRSQTEINFIPAENIRSYLLFRHILEDSSEAIRIKSNRVY
jgi:hypothetical protein